MRLKERIPRGRKGIWLSGILHFIAWALLIMALGVGSTGIYLVVAGDKQWREVLPVATLSFTACGVFIAVAGHMFTQSRDLKEAVEKRSKFYLEACISAYEEARKLLEDGNNDRIKWIAAGRALGHASALADNIVDQAHRRVFELHQLKYRLFFDGCLRDKTPAFFYGADDCSMNMEAAAAAHTAPYEKSGRAVTSAKRKLSEPSIHRVWEAAQWPKGYKDSDPLGAGFSEDERGALLVLYDGLYRYLEDISTHGSACGKRFKLDDAQN